MALINCEECGKEISSKAATCPHCGISIFNESVETEHLQQEPVNQTSVEEVVDNRLAECPDCGKPVSENAITCPSCGTSINKTLFGKIFGSMLEGVLLMGVFAVCFIWMIFGNDPDTPTIVLMIALLWWGYLKFKSRYDKGLDPKTGKLYKQKEDRPETLWKYFLKYVFPYGD